MKCLFYIALAVCCLTQQLIYASAIKEAEEKRLLGLVGGLLGTVTGLVGTLVGLVTGILGGVLGGILGPNALLGGLLGGLGSLLDIGKLLNLNDLLKPITGLLSGDLLGGLLKTVTGTISTVTGVVDSVGKLVPGVLGLLTDLLGTVTATLDGLLQGLLKGPLASILSTVGTTFKLPLDVISKITMGLGSADYLAAGAKIDICALLKGTPISALSGPVLDTVSTVCGVVNTVTGTVYDTVTKAISSASSGY